MSFLLYWVLNWYIPLPPITSEREAIRAVMKYLKDQPDTELQLTNREMKAYDDNAEWLITIDLSVLTRPAFVIYKVNKATGHVKPMPVR